MPFIALIIPGPESKAQNLTYNDILLEELDLTGKLVIKFDFNLPLKVSAADVPDQLFIDLSLGKEYFIDQ